MRKTIIALFALAAVGLVQPTAAFARGGGTGGLTSHRPGATLAAPIRLGWAPADSGRNDKPAALRPSRNECGS
jgi:hypothetical protein